MLDDEKRYDDDIYEDDFEDNDDGSEIDAPGYLDEDDEDENALWDEEEDATDADDANEPPEKPKRKRKSKVSFSDGDSYTDEAEADLAEETQRQIAKEQQLIEDLEADAEEHPFEDDEDEQPERKLLKRELRAQALARLEDASRTTRDFENVVAWWDRLDANRERRERYHELSRSGDDVPLDYGASVQELYFPDYLNNVLEKQIRNGVCLGCLS